MPELDPRDGFDRADLASPHILAETDTRLAPPVVIDGVSAGDGDCPDAEEDQGQGGDEYSARARAHAEEPWRRELRRWLLTLNPGRTQYEYEKAVTYFFTTPGVPQAPAELTFDLLLAYRGALAMRATAHAEFESRRTVRSDPRLGDPRRQALPGEGGEETEETDDAAGGGRARREHSQNGPLAPATVNLRLTALRQFLVYCALSESLPQLSADRIRAALKRLSIERRRPYQVLSEPEWEAFLQAARLPLRAAAPAPPRPTEAATDGVARGKDDQPGKQDRSPWGVPRAVRQRADAEHSAQDSPAAPQADGGASDVTTDKRQLPHSRAGLTGARTAQRDHALIALALATGLRAIELASLDVGDLSREWHAGREEWWLVLPDKKTKGQRGGRVLPLDGELITILMDYFEATGRRWERPRDRATPLFLSGAQTVPARQRRKAAEGETSSASSSQSGRLTPHSIRRIVDRVETQWLALRRGEDGEPDDEGDSAGETRQISPHALRHSTAIALLEGNDAIGRPPASVEHVRGWLGHFDIRTTQGYLAHLEGRKHRRPFTLSPGNAHSTGETVGASGDAPGRTRDADTTQTGM